MIASYTRRWPPVEKSTTYEEPCQVSNVAMAQHALSANQLSASQHRLIGCRTCPR